MALAAVPVEEGKTKPLLVAATSDEGKARATLSKSGEAQQARRPPAAWTTCSTPDGSLAAAVTDGAAIVGAAPAVELSLAAAEGAATTLTELQRYRNATGELPDGGIATAYVDLDSFAKALVRRSRRRDDRRAARDAADRPGRRDRRDADPEDGPAADRGRRHGDGQRDRRHPGQGRRERRDQDAPRRLLRSRSASATSATR